MVFYQICLCKKLVILHLKQNLYQHHCMPIIVLLLSQLRSLWSKVGPQCY